MNIRVGSASDLDSVRLILARSPEAAQWSPDQSDFFIAQCGDSTAGLLVWRSISSDESEILNLAVDPAFRRRGIAKALLALLPASSIFLEVRESNNAARTLYRKAGFKEVGLRHAYYRDPLECGIVMKRQS